MRFLTLCLLACATSAPAQHPIVPGVDRLQPDAGVSAAARGVVLLDELACTSCHAREHPVEQRAPRLDDIGARATPTWLRAYLLDPQATKPGTVMPDVLHALDAGARREQVEDLVHFLVARHGPIARSTTTITRAIVAEGRALYDSIGCAACHAPADEHATEVPSVPLARLATKTTVEALMRFLRAPHLTHPAARMPDFSLTEREARAIAGFLLRDQLENPAAQTYREPHPGLQFQVYEHGTRHVPDFSTLQADEVGTVDRFTLDLPLRTGDQFAVRFTGFLDVETDGDYGFALTSDDGSTLRIDGAVIVDNDGEHAAERRTGTVALTAGQHSIEVGFFEWFGGELLEVEWCPPALDGAVEPADFHAIPPARLTHVPPFPMIPLGQQEFVVDAVRAARGAEHFAQLGCATCHERAPSTAPTLDAIRRRQPHGAASCLAEPLASNFAVDFSLAPAQRTALRAATTEDPTRTLTAATAAKLELARFNCLACHERDGIGGVEPARDAHFVTDIDIDLGDEGRLPPRLTGAGDKLRRAALHAIVTGDAHRVRGRFMRARMPAFRQPRGIDTLLDALVRADRTHATATPSFREAAVPVGHRLAGTNGFACVTCHDVNGYRSPAIPGIDLATANARLNPDWLVRFLREPAKFKPDTRMPAFWGSEASPFHDLLDGSTTAQIEAVWSYLALGSSMPAPTGVAPPAGRPSMELVPLAEPIVHRTFMRDVGPRTILAGYPAKVHIAFDAHAVRLACAWRGRFFDAGGVTTGRTDDFLGPLGTEVLEFAAPAFARLADRDAAWPTIARGARDVGGEFLGYRLDAQRYPVFRYRLAGVQIEERPRPVLRAGGAMLVREFTLHADAPTELYFRACRGGAIKKAGESTWRCDAIECEIRGLDTAWVRRDRARAELLLAVPIDAAGAHFEVEVRW